MLNVKKDELKKEIITFLENKCIESKCEVLRLFGIKKVKFKATDITVENKREIVCELNKSLLISNKDYLLMIHLHQKTEQLLLDNIIQMTGKKIKKATKKALKKHKKILFELRDLDPLLDCENTISKISSLYIMSEVLGILNWIVAISNL